ncbi:hypothetical protein [Nocardioides sp.]|uniref:hypothetical protein n=1 Tax=Nocardioides sp. TaxID=35761 RepID=UPI00351402C8
MTRGHQLRFYTHPDDLPDLARGLAQLGALAVDDRTLEQHLATHELKDLRPGSTTLIANEELVDHLEPRFMPNHSVWVLTAGSDAVVELSTSPFDGRLLMHGRLYFIADYSTGDRFVRKPEELLTFAASVEAWLRGWLVSRRRRLVGPAAAVALDAGLVELGA